MVLLEPGVNAFPVKLVGARDDAQFLERGGERRRKVSKENHVTRPGCREGALLMEASLVGWEDVSR